MTYRISISHPRRLLKRELAAQKLSANRLSLDIGVSSGRITDILNGRRSITADTAVRLGRYSATARSSGPICKGSTISRWSSEREKWEDCEEDLARNAATYRTYDKELARVFCNRSRRYAGREQRQSKAQY